MIESRKELEVVCVCVLCVIVPTLYEVLMERLS